MNSEQLRIVIRKVFKNITLIDHDIIEREAWIEAHELVKDVDQKDTPFLATAISLESIFMDWR